MIYTSCIAAVFILSYTSLAELYTMVKNTEKKIMMDWTPKAACSVMVAMFFDSMNIRQGVNYTGFVHAYRREVFYSRFGRVTEEEFMNPSWYKFKVVKNPYDRMVSSYIQVMRTEEADSFFKHNVTLRYNASFEQFVTIYESFRKGFSGHVDPQSSEMEWKAHNSNVKLFNQIVRVEHFDTEIKKVNNDTGMNYAVGKYRDEHNAIRYNHDPTIFYGNVPFDFFKAGDNVSYPSSYKVFYDAALRKAVESIFKKDLILYGYSF